MNGLSVAMNSSRLLDVAFGTSFKTNLDKIWRFNPESNTMDFSSIACQVHVDLTWTFVSIPVCVNIDVVDINLSFNKTAVSVCWPC